MNLSHASAAEVKPELEPAQQLSYTEGYVYRAVWFSRFGKGRFPNSGTFNAGRLLMIVNTYRLDDGRRLVSLQHLRRTVTSLRDKGYLAFRPSRRRRRPTRDTFRRATYIECMVPIEAIRFLERGRHSGQTHRLPLIQKCALAVTPQEKRVGGHEVTKAPLEVTREKEAKAGDEPKNCSPPPAPRIQFSDDTIRIEKQLTEAAESASTHLEHPWEPIAQRRTDRLKAIEDTLGAGTTTEEEMLHQAVGQVIQRSGEIEYARKSGLWQEFWEVNHADPICRMLTYDDEDRIFRMMETGARALGNHHRQRELDREAAVGNPSSRVSSDSQDDGWGRDDQILGDMSEWLRASLER